MKSPPYVIRRALLFRLNDKQEMRKQDVSLTNEGCMMNALGKEYIPCSSNLHAIDETRKKI